MEKEVQEQYYYWTRSEFYSFGAFQECHCFYDFDGYLQHEAGNILLPPSPNWFITDTLDSREEDFLLISVVFKSILVYQFIPGEKLPTVLKVIPNNNERILGIKLCPIVTEPDYGHTTAAVCEGSVVRLFNIHTGDVITEHREHKDLAVNGICWGNVGGEEVVVTVGEGGLVVVWQPQHNTSTLHTLPQAPELTLAETSPQDRSQALVAANKDIALINLKTGRILTWLKGHDMGVYCMKWYEGEASPLTTDDLPTNSRAEALIEGSSRSLNENRNTSNNWRKNGRNNGGGDGGGGPYFASSDYGRNICVWDVAAKRYIAKVNAPVSAGGNKKHGVEKGKGGSKTKQHIPLVWHKNELLSSTVQGELLHWTSLLGKAKYTVLHHLHSRVIYNLVMLGDLVISNGQDRQLQGFNVATLTHTFQLPTLGGFATTLAFCPQDVTRLAIGSLDSTIRLLKFGSPTPLQCITVSQNIKGKVLSLAWHPEKEGRLLLSTSMGQVSWLDLPSLHLTTFAYYHQKAAYKVEWAPPVCPDSFGGSSVESWYAYSFGDREIVMRVPSSPMADPVNLQTLIPEPEMKPFPKDITEFSFSPDYQFMAVGLNDGQVRVYRRQNLEVAVRLVVVKKAVQHLAWRPKTEGGMSYTLAVGSNENHIYLFSLDSHIKAVEEGQISEVLVTQATRVLSGHEARVVWVSWSPHTPSLLASSSYDHTVQLWDADTGAMLGNYGGHLCRVYRAEFSPTDPDLVISCGEENFVHAWRPSKLTCKSPSERSRLVKLKHKKEQTPAVEKVANEPQEPKENGFSDTSTVPLVKTTTINDDPNKSVNMRKQTLKSFFPKLHRVTSQKKGFHHLVLLSMLAVRQAQESQGPQQKESTGKDTAEEDLEDLDGELLQEDQELDAHPIVTNTTEKYSFLLEKDAEMAEIDDFLYVMKMYGQPHQMDALLAKEIEAHEAMGNTSQVDLMQCWRGSLNNHIRLAAKQKKLTPFLVASAPQVSMKLWEMATEAYAEQLLAEGDTITAASYLLNIHKTEEAIDLLLNHRHYKEALAIVKSRLGYSHEHLAKVMDAWVNAAIMNGNMLLAALLQVSDGKLEAAAHTLSRRTDPSSFFVSAKLYASSGNIELALNSGVMALKEASIKQDFDKVEAFLCHLPDLHWFRVISCFHILLLRVVQQSNTNSFSDIVATPDVGDFGDAAPEAKIGLTYLLDEVKRQWVAQGFSQDNYKDLYQHITTHFSTQHLASSVKQLWFLVAVALCKCLLAPSCSTWDQHLTEALKYAVNFGKADQLLHLTHALLPNGKTDTDKLSSTIPESIEDTRIPSVLLVLWQLHQQSEIAALYSYLLNDTVWSGLQKDCLVTAKNQDVATEDVSLAETKALENGCANSCNNTVISAAVDCVSECGVSNSSNTVTTLNAAGVDGALSSVMKEANKVEEEKRSFCYPTSMSDLKIALNSYAENNDLDFRVVLEGLQIASESLSSPVSLVKKIIMLMHEKGCLNYAEVESFISTGFSL